MDHRIDTSGASALVICSGRLTFSDASAFHEIADQIKSGSNRNWIMDFSGLEFIDSAGLGMLLMARDLVEKSNGSLGIRHAVGQVRKALDLARFNQLMAIEE